jgi:hypothetical protein
MRLGLFLFAGQDAAHGGAANIEAAGDFRFADAGAVKLSDLAGRLADSLALTRQEGRQRAGVAIHSCRRMSSG